MRFRTSLSAADPFASPLSRLGNRALWLMSISLLVVVLASEAVVARGSGVGFTVLRDGSPFGTHQVSFRQEGEDLHVEIAIDLEVSLAFITLFRYEHRNHEIWREGRLVSIEARTDDNGTAYSVSGRATEAGFEVDGSEGRALLPAGILPTSYWHPKTVAQSQLLDTQRGRLIEVDVAPLGGELVRGTPLERFRVSGDLKLDLWYDADGEWNKLVFTARGSDVVYKRSSGAPYVDRLLVPQSAIAR